MEQANTLNNIYNKRLAYLLKPITNILNYLFMNDAMFIIQLGFIS